MTSLPLVIPSPTDNSNKTSLHSSLLAFTKALRSVNSPPSSKVDFTLQTVKFTENELHSSEVLFELSLAVAVR